MQEIPTRFTSVMHWLRRRAPAMSPGADVGQARYHAATEAAQLARQEAEAAERAKAAFLANLGHEIRTPLMSISGFADLLMRRGDLTEDQRRYVNLIRVANDALSAIIDDFPAAFAAAQSTRGAGTQASTGPGELCRGKILVVDDLESNREIVMAYLEDGGCDVVPASSGAEAIALLGKGTFDLVLMDIQMPDMDGIAATRIIRAMDAPLCDIPILAMTGNVLPQQIQSFIAAGMNDHLGKPLERNKLYSKLWCWLPRKHAAEPAANASSPLFNRTRLDELIDSIGQRKVEHTLRRFETQLAGCFHADIATARREAHDLINAAGVLGFELLLSHALALKDTTADDADTARHLADCQASRDAVLDAIATKVLPRLAAPVMRKAG